MQYTERPHNNKSTQPDSSFENVRPVNAGQNDSHKALGFDLPQHILKGFFGKKKKKTTTTPGRNLSETTNNRYICSSFLDICTFIHLDRCVFVTGLVWHWRASPLYHHQNYFILFCKKKWGQECTGAKQRREAVCRTG